MTATEAYPLHWPAYKKRTAYRDKSQFKIKSFSIARDELIQELTRLDARSPVLSSNIPVRLDGYPLAKHRVPDDPGVAAYFTHKGRPMCFACDRWDSVEQNIRAIKNTIEALRGISRWGSGDMLEAAFTGFTALPAPGPAKRDWWDVLECRSDSPNEVIKSQYHRLARDHHPDNGGDADRMAEINAAWDAAREARI